MRWHLLFGLALLSACSNPSPQGSGLSVSPEVVDFGEVVVGLLERRPMTFLNHTPEVVRVIEARPDDSIASAIRLERIPAALIAGDTAEAEVVFAPKAESTYSGSIRIVTDGDPSELTVTVSGVAVSPFLRAIPERIDFGRVIIGEHATVTATIANEGSTSVTISGITPDLETSDEFDVGPYAIETLGPGESFSFEISFSPASPGNAVGRVVIGDDSQRPVPLTIPVVGEGAGGDVELDPITIDFTGALVGEVRVRSFEVRNTGTARQTIDAIAIDQSIGRTFSIATSSLTLPFQLSPGEERNLSVQWAPDFAGSHSAAVVILSEAFLTGRGEVALFGNAYSTPISVLTVDRGELEFGGVEVGSEGARELTIESPGFIEVQLEGDLAIDPASAPFSLVRAPAGDAIFGPFDSHTLEVRYRPTAVGTDHALLRIQSDAASSESIEVALSGRGESRASSDADPRPFVLRFGDVPRDLFALRTIVLLNGGTAPLSITAVDLSDDAGGLYTLDLVPDTSPFGPGAARAIGIRYADPLGLPIPETGAIAISTDDPDRPLIEATLLASTAPESSAPAILVRTTALDLHLLRADGSLFDRPSDCCWCNPNPRWTDEIRPFLDSDRSGAQSIRLDRAFGRYGVEIHSRSDQTADVEVTVELAGYAPIVRTRTVGPFQRWRVGTIELDSVVDFLTESIPLDTPVEETCF